MSQKLLGECHQKHALDIIQTSKLKEVLGTILPSPTQSTLHYIRETTDKVKQMNMGTVKRLPQKQAIFG